MSTIWKHIRKPLVWGPLFVLSVFAFNVLMGHKIGTTAPYTFFATIFAICMANPSGEGYVRRKKHFEHNHVQQSSYLQKISDDRLMTYGSRGNYSIQDRNKTMFGR